MNKKNLILGLTVALSSQLALADSICAEMRPTQTAAGYEVSIPQCLTAGTAYAGAFASGIYAAKSYNRADSIEKTKTETIFTNSADSAHQSATVDRSVSTLGEGDRVTLRYRLSEQKNREYFIEDATQQMDHARSEAQRLDIVALTAEQDVYTTISQRDSDGIYREHQVKTGTTPDYARRAAAALEADSERQRAAQLKSRIASAREGGEVPVYQFEKIFDSTQNTRAQVSAFLRNEATKGSIIRKVDKLPANYARVVRSATRSAKSGLAGAISGSALALEELAIGTVANQIQSATSFKPAAGTR